MSAATAADRLAEAVAALRTCGCVGVDPVIDLMPAGLRRDTDPHTLRAFAAGVVDAACGLVPVVKFQAACFERFGAAGYAELERGVGLARERGLIVILDAKRGDIGSTSDHYAAAAARMGAHWITVNGYLGPSGIEPFLKAGLGVFVLVRTSNPDSDAMQSAPLASGGTVAEFMARGVAELGARYTGARGLSAVGAVVGATKADDALRLRAAMPSQVFLVPGYGAQGGTADDIARLRRAGGAAAGLIVNSSRAVTYPKGLPADATEEMWRESVRREARALADAMRAYA